MPLSSSCASVTLVNLFRAAYNPVMILALTIAGSDPSGGAGIQQDLKVFRAFGIYGISVVSSLTAQNSRGVEGIMPVPGPFVEKQLETLLSDMKPDATKTGMILTSANVMAIVSAIKRHSLKNVVVDPVMLSSTGRSLSKKDLPHAVGKKLLPLCTVVTPNIYEASVLSGIRITTMQDMEKAALRLTDLGAQNVIITGGHLDGTATDLLYDGRFHYLKGKKVHGEFHGTGCTFSAALAAELAKSSGVLDAAVSAKRFMKRVFEKTFSAGKGMRSFNI
jgi:hydroxymethylpyrimidine/phosphomethylpyrimidine kinase